MSKYKKGKRITSLDELAVQKFIFDSRVKKVYDRGWFQSWQFRYARMSVENGDLYTVTENTPNIIFDEWVGISLEKGDDE